MGAHVDRRSHDRSSNDRPITSICCGLLLRLSVADAYESAWIGRLGAPNVTELGLEGTANVVAASERKRCDPKRDIEIPVPDAVVPRIPS